MTSDGCKGLVVTSDCLNLGGGEEGGLLESPSKIRWASLVLVGVVVIDSCGSMADLMVGSRVGLDGVGLIGRGVYFWSA